MGRNSDFLSTFRAKIDRYVEGEGRNHARLSWPLNNPVGIPPPASDLLTMSEANDTYG